MKKSIIYILLIALVFSSCDEGFEELNVNPNASAQIDPSSKLTAALLYTAGSRYENWRTNLIYSSTMIQHFATTAGYWSGDKYSWNKGYAASQFDHYYPNAVKSIEDILVQLKAEEYPEETIAISRILRVLIYSKLTDLYGDIPYSEAGKGYTEGIIKPKYDAQSAIYADMLKELEESASVLTSGTSNFGAADVMFGGDQGKWKKFANSLMLRMALRMIKVDPAGAEAWATKAINGGVMTSNDDIAYIQQTAGPEGINKNGNGEVFTVDASMRWSKTFVAIMQGDPRLPIVANRRSDGSANPSDLVGLQNGLDSDLLLAATGEENLNNYAEPNRNLITGEDAPYFFQTYAEVAFMLAESNVRWGIGGDAATNYNSGVTAAMKMLAMYGDGGIISDGAITSYLGANPYNASNALDQINTQYWVVTATALNSVEAFANWRRVELPVLTPTNYAGNETNGTIPRRLTYPTSEQTSNPENYEAAQAAQGTDLLTTRIWWDVE